MGLAASNRVKPFGYLLTGTSLIRRDQVLMIHDTFETNLGLRELFKRKIIERARFVGLSEDLIDFETQIDVKGTYQDNLRIFYQQYPQLSENSDYFRIKSVRPLRGAALEQSWRSYKRNNAHEITELTGVPTEEPPTTRAIVPELSITYTVSRQSGMARKEAPEEHEPISINPTIRQATADPAASSYRELVNSILDRVTAMAGEKATRAILHQIRREIGRTPFNYSSDQNQSNNLVEALDHFLNIRGWGHVRHPVKKNEH